MKCQVSHYVAYMDEEQTMAYYDYFWCNVHHRKCGSNGCEAVEQGLHQTAGGRGSKKSKLVVPAAGNANHSTARR